MTLLAVPIAADTLAEARRLMQLAEAQGAELLELRLDLLPRGAETDLVPLASVPVLGLFAYALSRQARAVPHGVEQSLR